MKTPHAVRSLLVALVVALQLVTLVTLMSSTKSRLHQQFELNAYSSIDNKAAAVEEQVRLFMRTIEAQLISVKAHIEDGLININNDDQLKISFQSQLRANKWLKGAFVGRPDGSFVRVSQTSDQERLRTKIVSIKNGQRSVRHTLQSKTNRHNAYWYDNQDLYDPRSRHWYTLAQEQLAVAWTEPFRLYSSGKLGVTASTQLTHPDRSNLGVLSFSVDLHQITAFLRAALSDSTGSAVIVNKQGAILASTSDDLFAANIDGKQIPYVHQLIGEPLKTLVSTLYVPDHLPETDATHRSIKPLMQGSEGHIGLTRPLKTVDKNLKWELAVSVPVADFTGKMESFIDQSIAALIAMIAVSGTLALIFVFRVTAPVYQLYHRATVDPLTNALNRSEYEHRLKQLLILHNERKNTSQLVSVIMDLDGFKQVNDNHGHAAGDFVLSTVVKRLKAHAGNNALIGRLGGDEFALTVYLPDSVDISDWVENLRSHVVNKPAANRSGSFVFGMTCGISIADQRETVSHLMARADEALISGKLLEKNRCYLSEKINESERPPCQPLQIVAAAA